ncbi:hypothetical protein PaCe_00042 [Pseudomonas phage vB_PaeP_PaCe]|nr:hypothetical protein PaCe_00042 [Pseudomonas phage vB_PaeP_PaCe]
MAIVKYEKNHTKPWSELVHGCLYIRAEDLGNAYASVYKFLAMNDGDFLVEIFGEDDDCFNDAGVLEGPFMEVTVTEVGLRIV